SPTAGCGTASRPTMWWFTTRCSSRSDRIKGATVDVLDATPLRCGAALTAPVPRTLATAPGLFSISLRQSATGLTLTAMVALSWLARTGRSSKPLPVRHSFRPDCFPWFPVLAQSPSVSDLSCRHQLFQALCGSFSEGTAHSFRYREPHAHLRC